LKKAKSKFQSYLIIGIKGMAMGAADVVPGVSGGTIAFITGIYEQLISSISQIDVPLIKKIFGGQLKEVWRQVNGNFLMSLLIGIGISVLTLAQLAHYLLKEHPIFLWSFFFGLVVASILYIGKQIEKWRLVHVISAVIAIAVAYFITRLMPASGTDNLFYLFLCGSIAISAMILPGISGAFILVLMGAYSTVTKAISDFDLKTVAVFGLGAVIGLLSFSKLLKWLFDRHKNLVLAILTGFITGSLNKVWPWKKILETRMINGKEKIINEISIMPWNYEGEALLIYAILFAIAGFILIFGLEYFSKRNSSS
jgi:putative membrane protein